MADEKLDITPLAKYMKDLDDMKSAIQDVHPADKKKPLAIHLNKDFLQLSDEIRNRFYDVVIKHDISIISDADDMNTIFQQLQSRNSS